MYCFSEMGSDQPRSRTRFAFGDTADVVQNVRKVIDCGGFAAFGPQKYRYDPLGSRQSLSDCVEDDNLMNGFV